MSYMFDPTGKALQNKVIGEEVPIGAKTPGNQLFVFFQHTPFFWEDVVVKHVSPTGVAVNLINGVDYIPGYQYFDATSRLNRMVVGCIELKDITRTGKLVVVYQCLGSAHSPSAAQLTALRANEKRDPQFTTWEMVCEAAGMPLVAIPTLADIYSRQSESVIETALESLRKLGLSVQLRPKLLDGNDEHVTIPTAEEIGLGFLKNFPIATEQEARAGTNATSYMTPQRTAQAIDSAMIGRLREIGYAIPTPYAAALTITDPKETISFNGDVFAPRSTAMPITTTGDFSVDRSKFILLSTSNRATWQGYSFKITGTEPVDASTGGIIINTGLSFDADVDTRLIAAPNAELIRQIDYFLHNGTIKLIFKCGVDDEFAFLWRRKNALMTGDRPYHHVITVDSGTRIFTLPGFDERSPDDVRLTLNEFVILTNQRDYDIASGVVTFKFPLQLDDVIEVVNQDAVPQLGVLVTRSILHSI